MKRKNQSGYFLAEIAIGVILLALISNYATSAFVSALNFNAKTETKTRLDAWRSAIESFYFAYAMTIDGDSAAQLNLGGSPVVIIPKYEPNPITKKCDMDATKITELANRAGYAATDIVKDGHKRSFCMFITPRLSQSVNGSTLYYHSIAIVSPGSDGVVDANTTLTSAGELKIATGTDDSGILFDGRKFSADKYNSTIDSLHRIIDAYTAYYSARYQADSGRSLTTDYFSCGKSTCPSTESNWDMSGEMIGTCSGAINMNPSSGAKPYQILGLSVSDSVNGWNGNITMDNCTDAVRSPNSTNSTRKLPPFTALISTTIPGGNTISATAVGKN